MAEQHISVGRIPQIELLRVIATLGIFLYHLWTVVPLSSDAVWLAPLLDRIPVLGALGVIVFNGITGFVLALPYLGRASQPPLPGVWDFFRSRFGRIGQYYYPVLLLWTLPWLLFEAHSQSWPGRLVAFATHLVFVHTLHPDTFFAIVPALWWLGLLAQLYLVYPWLLRFFQWLSAGKACASICLSVWSAWCILTLLSDHFPGSTWAMLNYMAYFNLPMRLPEFALGMWLAAAWNRGVPLVHMPQAPAASGGGLARYAWPVLLVLLFGCLLQDAWIQRLFGPLAHMYLVGWCTLATLAVLRWPAASRLGNTRLNLALAATSYGIYLLHQPLLGYATVLLGDFLSPGLRFVILGLVIGVLCYRAALLLNLLVFRLFR